MIPINYKELADLLKLIEDKLRRGNTKDGKLDASLEYATDSLRNCIRNVNYAWHISNQDELSSNFPDDIRNYVHSNFKEKDWQYVFNNLSDLYNSHKDTSFRLARCLLYLSKNSTYSLDGQMSTFDDPRNLMLWAEYEDSEEGPIMVRNFNNPFNEVHNLETGLEQQEQKPLTDEDMLPF